METGLDQAYFAQGLRNEKVTECYEDESREDIEASGNTLP